MKENKATSDDCSKMTKAGCGTSFNTIVGTSSLFHVTEAFALKLFRTYFWPLTFNRHAPGSPTWKLLSLEN